MTTYLNSNNEAMTAAAFFSLQAAFKFNSIGRDAAIRFAMKRASISFNLAIRLITIARQLQASENARLEDFLNFLERTN